jgi:acetyl-CoA carboxylase biotin carboxyl carrier protein
MNLKEVKELIALISKSNIAEFKIRDNDFELTIRTDDYQKGKTTQVFQSPVASAAPQPVIQAAPVAAPAPAAPAAAPAPAADANAGLLEIRSPMVGTFYRSAGPDKPAFVKVGDAIETGQKVCIIEAMKLFNEIEAEIKGKIVKIVAEDATPVEYDQLLFLVDPKG